MAFLFKSLRRRLFKEPGVLKYFLYALGEVLLVVFGILIAIRANNYNEKLQAKRQTEDYLKATMEDLALDTLYLTRTTEVMRNQLQIEEWLLYKQHFSLEDLDSIRLSMSTLNWSFQLNDRAFSIVQGNLEANLEGYEDLLPSLTKYYQTTAARIDRNNQREEQRASQASMIEEVVLDNLQLTTMEYSDVTGFGVKLSTEAGSRKENPQVVLDALQTIRAHNELNDRYARHNQVYMSLVLANTEAKSLYKQIDGVLHKMQ